MLKLIIEDDEGRKTVVPFVRDEITIGRQEGNTIRLTERNVSRRHARLMRNDGQVLIEDLGSYNGIRINGDRISGQVQVADGDLIQIGDYDLAVQAENEPHSALTVPLEGTQVTRRLADTSPAMTPLRLPPAPADAPQEAADEDVKDVDAAPEPASESNEVGKDTPPSLPKHQATALIRVDQVEGARRRPAAPIPAEEAPRLVVLNTDYAGREFVCDSTELKIGRTDDNDIVLDHRSLSRTHCKVVKEETGEWRVLDMQSANGLMVNGESYSQVTLRPGDVIELGHVKLKFLGPGEQVEALPAPTASSTTEDELEPVPARAPLIATAIALLVLLLGGGGYWLWKSTGHPSQAEESAGVPKGPPTGPTVPKVDPQVEKKAALAKLALATTSAAELDWPKAQQLAKEATLGGELIPEAATFLTALDYESNNRDALARAAQFLEVGNLDDAKKELASATETKLLRARYDEIESSRIALLAEKPVVRNDVPKPPVVPKPVVPKVNPPNVVPNPPVAKDTLAAEALFKEAKEEMKAGNFQQAAKTFEKCIAQAPTYHRCYAQLGSVYAAISNLEQSEDALQKARKYYELYLKYAPAEDGNVPKVKAILENFKAKNK